MTLVDFDAEVRIARYTQQDFPRMVERIRTRKLGGETAFYDALGVYLDGSAEADGRTVLVIFTDGGDTRSAIPFKDVMFSCLYRRSELWQGCPYPAPGSLISTRRFILFHDRGLPERA